MRVAIVAGPHYPVPPSGYGGTERIVFHIVKGLIEAGHKPILLGSGDSTVDCEVIPVVQKAIYFPKFKRSLPAFQIRLKAIEQRTKDILHEIKDRVDIIHSHGFDLKHFTDFPNLTTIHNEVKFEDIKYYVARKNLYYVTISKNQQNSIPSLQYIDVVYNGEDPDDFPVVEKPQNYICFIGRMEREKNPHLAIQLAINLKMKIKLAGKIDFHGIDYYKTEIEPYLKHPLVEYLGEIDSAERTQLLSKAKCNLHPTNFREPFGLTVMEAAYCGTPTLAITRGSMPELIEVGRTGMLVEDFVEGYHQIEECFKMDRRYIARRTRLLFNYKTMTTNYLQAYDEVISRF